MWKYIPCAIPFASAVLGIAGLPAHLKGWAEWIDVIDHVALWYTLAGASLVAAFGMAVWDWRQTRLRYFDIPILDAVNHLIQTEPHSYGQSGAAERLMFRLLHAEMCSGKLRVIGRKGETGTPRRISAAQCKRLTPRAAVIPRSPAAPYGIRYSLFDDQQVEYLGLRMRSRDLYRRWRKGEKSNA